MFRTARVTTTSSRMAAAAITILGDGKKPRRLGVLGLNIRLFPVFKNNKPLQNLGHVGNL
jgi:hypothetical protein